MNRMPSTKAFADFTARPQPAATPDPLPAETATVIPFPLHLSGSGPLYLDEPAPPIRPFAWLGGALIACAIMGTLVYSSGIYEKPLNSLGKSIAFVLVPPFLR